MIKGVRRGDVGKETMERTHRRGDIGERRYLLVGEDQKNGIAQLILCQHPHQLLSSLVDALAVVAVHHEDQPYQGDTHYCYHHEEQPYQGNHILGSYNIYT